MCPHICLILRHSVIQIVGKNESINVHRSVYKTFTIRITNHSRPPLTSQKSKTESKCKFHLSFLYFSPPLSPIIVSKFSSRHVWTWFFKSIALYLMAGWVPNFQQKLLIQGFKLSSETEISKFFIQAKFGTSIQSKSKAKSKAKTKCIPKCFERVLTTIQLIITDICHLS